ncbi:MAG: DUF4097 family beta strand repeat protein [Armatimonadetes bacterium]|nr:DUF4097 family beta strand repeat protein [Armatimonadota bacterium]
MKDEIRRIMQLVKDGKLSPEDAAELVEAFEGSERSEDVEGGNENGAQAQTDDKPREEEVATKHRSGEPFQAMIESIENIGKHVAESVNWKDVAGNIRSGVDKGVDAVKKAADGARLGKGPFGTFFGTHESKTVELPLDVPEGKVLRIEGEAGDVKITGGADVGSLTATATFRAQNEEDAKAKADLYTPVIEESDQYVLLRQPEGSDFTVDLEIYVPEGVPVEIRLQSGDVRVIDTLSSCRVIGRSGDVTLINLEGSIDVSLYSGDVRIEDSTSTVMTVETKSGDIKLINTRGVMNVRTSSGDVRVKGGAGRTLSIEAASGDVSVEMAEPVQGAMNVRTVSGDARILIPDGSDCQVMLSTLRGSVSSTLDLKDLNQESLTITGKLGDGSGSIDISAVNGDVHLGLTDSS